MDSNQTTIKYAILLYNSGDYQSCLNLLRPQPEVRDSRFYVYRSLCNYHLGNYKESMDDITKLTEIFEGNRELHAFSVDLMSKNLIELHRYDEALRGLLIIKRNYSDTEIGKDVDALIDKTNKLKNIDVVTLISDFIKNPDDYIDKKNTSNFHIENNIFIFNDEYDTLSSCINKLQFDTEKVLSEIKHEKHSDDRKEISFDYKLSYNVSAYESSSLISDQRIIFDKNDNGIIQVIKREGDEILENRGYFELEELEESMEIKTNI
ncbi:MAG: hypothetical protein IPI93_10600 [Sphingobacteriaceae bacterium]|nr:hypothetical protein [Sphingobacteriaceae bacterium]